MREAKLAAKENEEVYILKALEERERMTQRIVRLQLELEAKKKEIVANEIQSKVLNEVTKTLIGFREVSKPLVDYPQLVPVIHQFKATLINSKKPLSELKDQLFVEYKADERISIKELGKVFQRKPLYLPLAWTEDLARYLVEPRDSPEVAYNKYREILIADVRIKLDTLLNINYPTNLNSLIPNIMRNAVSKLKARITEIRRAVNTVVAERGELDSVTWIKICKDHLLEFSPIEHDCLVALMIDERNDVRSLEFSVWFNIIPIETRRAKRLLCSRRSCY
eukprot:TRINITY_DN4378_c0_g1_i5.p1 TRINITY_DN4378_c0_g1~~TRINITY_DN4378_c0_g1_i5.p1  ORF type:complete len:280 (-),score=50.91 TRINITY_DN4378_c0_g1_i5:108-947(-)